MPRWLRWIGYGLGGLVGLVLLALIVLYAVSGRTLNKTYDFSATAPVVESTEELIEYGHRLADIWGCTGCHTDSLGGEVFFDNFVFGRLASSNLTAGRGGIGSTYTDADFARAIRHGVNPDGKPFMLMPSHLYNDIPQADLGALVAFIRSAPPVDLEHPSKRLGPLARGIIATGGYELPVSHIDHSARPLDVEPGVTAEYGRNLVRVCRECHGEDLGGVVGDGGGGPPPGPNLTRGGGTAEWSDEDFIQTMRTGIRPDDRPFGEEMPWEQFSKMTDDELRAVWMYLRSLPPSSGPESE